MNRDNAIIEAIIKKYNLAEKDERGYYYIEIMSDVKNSNIENYIADIFLNNNFKNIEDVNEHIYNFVYDVYAETETDYLMDIYENIAEHWNEFGDYEIDPESLKELVLEFVYVNYDNIYNDIYNLNLNCFVALTNTNNEMNYDFSESNLWEYRRNDSGNGKDGEFSYDDFESLHNSNKFLCLSQGENMYLLYDYIFNYNNKTKYSEFIDSLGEEYMNATYGGCVIFLCSIPVKDYINIKFETNKNNGIIVSANAVGGIFDWTNGSGGPLELKLNNDIALKPGMFKLFIDGEIGYSVDETYGLTNSEWKENVIKIINIKNNRNDKKILESLIKKYGIAGVKGAINKLNEALDKPLFRKPINFIGGTQDDIFKTLDKMINDGELDYVDIWNVYTKYDINDELVYEILARNNWKNVSPNNRRFVLDMFGKYFDNAYADHLVDIDNDGMAYITEDIDTGQYTSVRDRRTISNDIDNSYYLKVRKLRRALDNTDDPIEIRKIQKNIDNLKREYRLNEWNMWDGDKRRTYRSDRMSITHNHQSRYKNDPELNAHIKRLERQLENTTDEQEAEYLQRRIDKLKRLYN